jgi:hypothetical protein
MELQPIKTDDLIAEIWRNAQMRRAEDMSAWLRSYFELGRQRSAARDAVASHPEGHPVFR